MPALPQLWPQVVGVRLTCHARDKRAHVGRIVILGSLLAGRRRLLVVGSSTDTNSFSRARLVASSSAFGNGCPALASSSGKSRWARSIWRCKNVLSPSLDAWRTRSTSRSSGARTLLVG